MKAQPVRARHLDRLGSIGAHLVALVAVQLVLILGFIGFAAFQDLRSARSDAAAQVQATADLAADYVASDVSSTLESVDSLPDYASVVALPNVCELTESKNEDKRLIRNDVLIADYSGAPMCGNTRKTVAGEDWFHKAIRSKDVVTTGMVKNPLSGDDSIIYALAFPKQQRVLGLTIVLKSITTSLEAQFGANGGTLPQSFVVTSADRATEYSSHGERSGRALSATPFGQGIRDAGRTFDGLDGEEGIYGESVVEGLGWHVYAGVPVEAVMSGATRSLRERVLFAVIAVLIVIAVALFLCRRFVLPIRSLARAMRKVAEGDLSVKVEMAGPTELSELAEGFNEMLGIRQRAEEALVKAYGAERKAAAELRDVADMRQAFLMAISHELRTPLTSIVGYSTFLNESMDDLPAEQVRRSIGAITSQSKRLERLMLDLLDVERMSRGIIEPNLVETDVAQLVMRVIDHSSAPRRIRVDITGNVHGDIDPALVERIVENLVVNAIKHTPPDSRIVVRAKRANGQICLSVEDSGDGVPDALKMAIFEPFVQGEVPEHSPGTGVGLNLVSQFSKLHGGRAWVEDRRGGGAVFRIELPA